MGASAPRGFSVHDGLLPAGSVMLWLKCWPWGQHAGGR